MARSKRAGRAMAKVGRAKGRKASGKASAVSLTRKHRRIVALTREIMRLEADLASHDAMGRMAIGGLLAEVKEQLVDHGEWEAWLVEEVPYGIRTAQRYMVLHRWGQRHPGLAKRHAELGPTKLYELAKLDDRRLERLVSKKRHPVRRGVMLTLQQMSVEQLKAILGRVAALQEEQERAKLVQGMNRGVRRIVKVSDALADHADHIAPSIALSWRDQLRRAADRLDEVFGFE